MIHNTSVSKMAHWDWRLMPADRRNGEVRTYYLSPEELEKYKKGEKKMTGMNEVKQEHKKSIKEVLERDLGTKTIEQIAEEQGLDVRIVKMVAARYGFLKKEEKDSRNNHTLPVEINFKIKGTFVYHVVENDIVIRQNDKKRISLPVNELGNLIEELKIVYDKARKLKGAIL